MGFARAGRTLGFESVIAPGLGLARGADSFADEGICQTRWRRGRFSTSASSPAGLVVLTERLSLTAIESRAVAAEFQYPISSTDLDLVKGPPMTKDILHTFLIHAAPQAIADALTQEKHIQNWWTREASIRDGKAELGWSGHGWSVELVIAREGDERVLWTCRRSNMMNTDAWEGTTIAFVLTPQSDGTRVDFAQTGYRDSPCYDVCHQGWSFFVGTSLKHYLETGKGIPYPEMPDTRDA